MRIVQTGKGGTKITMTVTSEMTTKDRIVEEALTLFSTKGFKGTSVKNIADAVGIKDASLYKHFKSKQEILDTIVETMRHRIEGMSLSMDLPTGEDYEKAAKVYGEFGEETLAALSKQFFLFYLKDPFVCRFWRMGTIEQFQNPEVSRVYRKLFLEDSITYQTGVFSKMIDYHLFRAADPQVMAIYFYTPIFFLLSKYNNHPELEEEALLLLDKQVREFYRIYRKDAATSESVATSGNAATSGDSHLSL